MLNDLKILSLAFEYAKRRTVKADLCQSIKTVRSYLHGARNGAFDYLQNYPCGYQDAHGDNVNRMFDEFSALKIAYDLQNNSTKRFNRIAKSIGEW